MASTELERNVAKVLHEVSEARRDPWGEQGMRLANSVREGTTDVAVALAALPDSFGRILEVSLSRSADQLSGHLVQLIALQEGVLSALSMPLATAVQERNLRGERALRNGWLTEAEEEFRTAVSTDQFNAQAHLGLGAAIAAQGPSRLEEAAESLALSVKYSVDVSQQAVASAALLYMSVRRRAGTSDSSMTQIHSVVRDAASRAKQVPEVLLLAAEYLNDERALCEAILLAPDLAVAAAMRGIPGFEAAARNAVTSSDGPFRRATACHRAVQNVALAQDASVALLGSRVAPKSTFQDYEPPPNDSASDAVKLGWASEYLRHVSDHPLQLPAANNDVLQSRTRAHEASKTRARAETVLQEYQAAARRQVMLLAGLAALPGLMTVLLGLTSGSAGAVIAGLIVTAIGAGGVAAWRLRISTDPELARLESNALGARQQHQWQSQLAKRCDAEEDLAGAVLEAHQKIGLCAELARRRVRVETAQA